MHILPSAHALVAMSIAITALDAKTFVSHAKYFVVARMKCLPFAGVAELECRQLGSRTHAAESRARHRDPARRRAACTSTFERARGGKSDGASDGREGRRSTSSRSGLTVTVDAATGVRC